MGSNFILLPPARVLDQFLRTYAASSEVYYPVTPGGRLDPNAMLCSPETFDKASALLLLLMIAQGTTMLTSAPHSQHQMNLGQLDPVAHPWAGSDPADPRLLTGGLTETCRISLFDVVEANMTMAGNATVLTAASVFITQAAWSGDKWQMDIAMGQRGIYMAMLRHSEYLENNERTTPVHTLNSASWDDWIRRESNSR